MRRWRFSRAHRWRQPGHRSARLVDAGTLVLLVFTPLAFGTVQPWSEALAEILVLGIAVAWLWGKLAAGGPSRADLPPGTAPAALFLALALLQAVPLAPAVVGLLAPFSAEAHRLVAEATGAPSLATLSLDPHATWGLALKLLAVAVFFVVLHDSLRDRARALRVVGVMIVTGTAVALFGIVQRATWNGRLYWVGPESHANGFGPFVNRAHFDGLMLSVIPMGLALVIARHASAPKEWRRRPMGRLQRLRAWAGRQPGPMLLVPFLVLLAGGAALVTGSRGGLVAVLLALLAMVGIGAGRPEERLWPRLALAATLIVLTGLWIGSDIFYGTLERLAAEALSPAESFRAVLWRDALGLWAAAPALGSGLGAFEVAFPRFRTIESPFAFTHAESDWLQLLTDTGVVGLGLALATGTLLALALLRRFRRGGSLEARCLALGGLVALLGAAAQGIANFNLPVMSNQLYLAAALAVGLQAGRPSETE